MTASIRKISREQLRSRLWFDNPDNPGITALYIARNLNYSLAGAELQGSKPVHLNAIARHVGVPLDCTDRGRVGFEIPLLVDMQPAGAFPGEKCYRTGVRSGTSGTARDVAAPGAREAAPSRVKMIAERFGVTPFSGKSMKRRCTDRAAPNGQAKLSPTARQDGL